MNDVLLFGGLGFSFLVFLAVWFKRGVDSPPPANALSDVREVSTSLKLELPPRALGERIFSTDDWEFISESAPERTRQQFLEERKALAVAWLRRSRSQVSQLMMFHRSAVRRNVELDPALEARLALHYAFFLTTCGLLCLLVRISGPFTARAAVAYSLGAVDHLGYLSGRVLVGLDPARLSRIQRGWLAKASSSS